jgi:membrane-associated phospholipid phosphatase
MHAFHLSDSKRAAPHRLGGAVFNAWPAFLALLLCLAVGASAQSVYQLQTGRELSLLGAGVGAIGLSAAIDGKTQALDAKTIEALSAREAPVIDRWVTRQWSPAARRISDKLLLGSLALPATMYFDQPARTEAGKVGLLYWQTLLLCAGATNLTKTLVKRPRPFLYNPELPLEMKQYKDGRYSFFSGHTSLCAAASFLSAQLYNDFYPDSKGKPYVWAAAATLPALTGYLRVRAGKHYLTDVLVGYGVGALIGTLVPRWHRQ